MGIGDWGLGPIPNPQSPYSEKILNKYQINLIDLFKIKKLQTKGLFKINLDSVFDSVNKIYTRKVSKYEKFHFKNNASIKK